MKIICQKKDLFKGLQQIQSAISSKITLPILSNFLLETEQNRIKLTATDLDTSVSCYVLAQIKEEGQELVPAKRLFDITKEISGDLIEIVSNEEHQIKIKTNFSKLTLIGADKKEFPILPKVEEKVVIKLQTKQLVSLFKKTIYAVSLSFDRYAMQGVLLEISKGTIKAVASDGKRLSFVKESIEEKDVNASIIIPTKSVSDILKLISLNETICEAKIYISNTKISVMLGETIFQTKLIESQYPDYNKIINVTKKEIAKIKLNVKDTIVAVRQMALMAQATQVTEVSAIKLNFTKNKVVFSINTSNGSAQTELDIVYSGEQFEINFNPIYLKDMLENIEDENIFFICYSLQEQAFFIPEQNKNELYIVMPMLF